jgi:hypothetical protein
MPSSAGRSKSPANSSAGILSLRRPVDPVLEAPAKTGGRADAESLPGSRETKRRLRKKRLELWEAEGRIT